MPVTRLTATPLQRKAALRAADLLGTMGPAAPSVPLADAPPRTQQQFTGKKYASMFAVDSYPALGNLNQATQLARDTVASNLKLNRKPAKGGF